MRKHGIHQSCIAFTSAVLAISGCDSARPLAAVTASGTPAGQPECTRCHGGQDNQTGAPPLSVRGLSDRGALDVEAHTAHVTAGALGLALECRECHPDPRFGSTEHMDSRVEVEFGDLARTGGAAARFDAAAATCSNVYCHGAFRNGNAQNAPDWTQVGNGQGACGTCHGLPPSGGHPIVAGVLTRCAACHPDSVDAFGNVKPAPIGTHLDGQIQFSLGHDAAWMDPASPAFHAFSADVALDTCQVCHGPALDGTGGVTTVACAQCHGPGGPGHDFATCTACHGGTDNQSGAPPAATWGHDADPARGGGTAADRALRVGAHTAHLLGASAPPFDCAVCHVKPGNILAPGHIDGSSSAGGTLSGLAALGTTSPPTWDRTTAICAGTYCHGATIRAKESVPGSSPRGTNVAPQWNGGASQAACGTCHGLPPDTGGHWAHVVNGAIGGNLPCSWCHNGYPDYPSDADVTVVPSLHVNGVADVIVSPDAASCVGVVDCTPGIPLQRVYGWDSQTCHNAVACHGLMN